MPSIAAAVAMAVALSAASSVAAAADDLEPRIERLVARIEASPAGCAAADAGSAARRTIEADVAAFRRAVPAAQGVAIDVLDCYWDGMVDRGRRLVISSRLARATPAQRFFVIAHEFGHFLLRHHASFAALARTLLETDDERAAAAALDAGAAAPLSRRHESEADAVAVQLMLDAGHDPEEAARFWERLGAGPAAASRTHPAPSERARAIRALAARPIATLP